jgi:hypothetical protein
MTTSGFNPHLYSLPVSQAFGEGVALCTTARDHVIIFKWVQQLAATRQKIVMMEATSFEIACIASLWSPTCHPTILAPFISSARIAI